ncbi:MAG: DUF2924 domain-containing protein [Planctomycetes bacterium]|nr:DUF2924 domain-containing protein [Planctomycetota bacterium]
MTTDTLEAALTRLRGLPMPELIAEYEKVFGRPPRAKHRAYLAKRIAARLEEQRLGGLSGLARRRLDALMREIDIPLGPPSKPAPERPSRPGLPPVGTVLTREWRGREIRVEVVADGFVCEGNRYRSLTAVAHAVTGAHWNPTLFFALAPRGAR